MSDYSALEDNALFKEANLLKGEAVKEVIKRLKDCKFQKYGRSYERKEPDDIKHALQLARWTLVREGYVDMSHSIQAIDVALNL